MEMKNDCARACNCRVEEKIVRITGGEWLEEGTGGSGHGGIVALTARETRKCIAICVWRGQCMNFRGKEMAEREASNYFSHRN